MATKSAALTGVPVHTYLGVAKISTVTTHHDVEVEDGSTIHWRAAGPETGSIIVLLHGFGSSSIQYRNLIPLLAADGYRVLAPDYPNFGLSKAPAGYVYRFASYAKSIMHWLDHLGVETWIAYIFDWGAPVAFNIAMERPKAIRAMITQNGNLYEEGLGPAWDARRGWWARGDKNEPAGKEIVMKILSAPVKGQYENGTPVQLKDRLDPTMWYLDYLQNIKGKEKDLFELFWDYKTNVASYPVWQNWLRDSKIPVLACWGKGDVLFIPPGCEAFKRDAPEARIVLLDGGHFLLESHLEEVYKEVAAFLSSLKCA